MMYTLNILQFCQLYLSKTKKKEIREYPFNIFIFQLEKPSVRKTRLSWNLQEK